MLSSPIAPGRSTGTPGWWRLRDTSRQEFAANQRIVGLLLLLLAMLVPALAVAIRGGFHHFTFSDLLTIGVFSMPFLIAGAVLIRNSRISR
jgi:uncharacterized membrane protein YqaE (UPF0057 family)